MGNLFDYLDWRGDIPFSADPFGEVDNLLLSELAYVDFEGIVPGPETGERIPITQACERFWETHTEEEERARNTFYKLAPFLLKDMRNSRRYEGMELGRYVNLVLTEQDEQMSAVTFYLGDGTVFVAYRGTDNTIVGWKEDFCLSFMEETQGQKQAAAYLSEVGAEYLSDPDAAHAHGIRVGGHSKGGNFAVFAAAFCDPRVQEHITEVYTNDGPGFLEGVVDSMQYQRILPRIRSIIPEESVFGLLLSSGYSSTVIKSSERGIMQHDALSWEILRNRFVLAQGRTEASLFAERAIDKWISGIPMEDRRDFVYALFDMLSSSGAETFNELYSDKAAVLGEVLRSYRELGEDEQKILLDTAKGLVKSGAGTLAQQVQDSFQRAVRRRKEQLGLEEKPKAPETREDPEIPEEAVSPQVLPGKVQQL